MFKAMASGSLLLCVRKSSISDSAISKILEDSSESSGSVASWSEEERDCSEERQDVPNVDREIFHEVSGNTCLHKRQLI